MSQHMPEHDPRSRFEDEGIPDLQDGTPEQRWAVDPQEAPLPADQPAGIDEHGTTVEEQIEGEPLDSRLAREVPEQQAVFGADEPPVAAQDQPGSPGSTQAGESLTAVGEGDASLGREDLAGESGLGVGSDLDTSFEQDTGVEPEWPAQPEEPSGQVWDEPRRAGRLVAPDEGAHTDREPDEVAHEVGPDAGGYSAEEAAMRVEPESGIRNPE